MATNLTTRIPIIKDKTVHPYATLMDWEKILVTKSIREIEIDWATASIASPFPAHVHPDPNAYDWGSHLLSRLDVLAAMTRRQEVKAVGWIMESIEVRNRGLDGVERDFVIRLEDIEYAEWLVGRPERLERLRRAQAIRSIGPPCEDCSGPGCGLDMASYRGANA